MVWPTKDVGDIADRKQIETMQIKAKKKKKKLMKKKRMYAHVASSG